MSPGVVLDADFLSAFLKIEALSLVRGFYQVDHLLVPPAVYREVSLTDLLPGLTALPWIEVQAPEAGKLRELLDDDDFHRLGPGEQEAIALAAQLDSMLLTNDNQARRTAARLGLEIVNVPAFLLACKLSGFMDRTALSEVIAALQEKDRYGFRKDVLKALLP